MKIRHVSLVERGTIGSASRASGFYGCWKDDHKVRDCPIIAAKGRQSKNVARLYTIRARGSNPNDNYKVSICIFFFEI